MKTMNNGNKTNGWWKPSLYGSMALLLLAGCEKNETSDRMVDSNRIDVSALINGAKQTQSRVSASSGTAFEVDDEIGIFVVDNIVSGGIVDDGTLLPSGNHADNVKHTLTASGENGTGWVSASGSMLWTNNQNSIYLTAYYPYQSDMTANVTDMTQVPFSVKTDQSKKETSDAKRTNYQLSDFLWARSTNATKATGTGTSGTPVGLKFNHVLSKATINVTFNDEFKNASGTVVVPTHTIAIVGTGIKALTDFTVKTTVADGKPVSDATLVTADRTNPANVQPITPMVKTAATPGGTTASYQAIVVPQTVTNNTLITITATVNGEQRVYNYTPASFEFKSGLHHTFNITVGSYDITVATTTAINDWVNGSEGTGDADKASVFHGNLYWSAANFGTNDSKPLGDTYTWGTSLAPAGFRLPTEVEFAAILPVTTGTPAAPTFKTSGYTTSGEEQYYSDGTNTIYGIKKDADNKKYWMCWQYLTTTAQPANCYLKISTWTEEVPTNSSFDNLTGTEAEKLAVIKAMFPKTQSQILILPATNADTTSGSYWTETKDKCVQFNATSISIPAEVASGSTKCSVRCIQKFN